MTRRNLFTTLFLLAVMAFTVRSVVRETHADDQYGMARIHLTGQTVYVKTRRCNVGCAPGIWLSRSSDRCQAPDPATDYTFNSEQVVYAREDRTLLLAASPRAITRPTSGDWLDLRFLPAGEKAAAAGPLRAIIFGDQLPERNVPSERFGRSTCIRAFGHDWSWL